MEEEFNSIENKNEWNHLFYRLRAEADKHEFSHSDAKKKENKVLNRYRDVVPYDHSRIKLARGNGDYINANLIPVEEAGRKYILTQGPLPYTVGHFWAMVWEQSSKAILMLNGLIERGHIKCHQYWPTNLNEPCVHDDVNLSTELVDEDEKEHFITRKILLKDLSSHDKREILQFHYTSWPDFGLPESPSSFLQFLFAVRQSGSLDLTQHGPPIVHCSAGIGRSGTLCLVDSCLVLIEQSGNSANVDVKKILLDMRSHRMGLIQTAEQLRFSYMAIIEGIQTFLPNNNTSPTNNGANSNGNDTAERLKLNIITSKRPTDSPFLSSSSDPGNGIESSNDYANLDIDLNNQNDHSSSFNSFDNINNQPSVNLNSSSNDTEMRHRMSVAASKTTATASSSTSSSDLTKSSHTNGSSLSTDEIEKKKQQREEQQQKLRDKVARIKEKQKEAEALKDFKDKLRRWAGYGFAAVLLIAGFIYMRKG